MPLTIRALVDEWRKGGGDWGLEALVSLSLSSKSGGGGERGDGRRVRISLRGGAALVWGTSFSLSGCWLREAGEGSASR